MRVLVVNAPNDPPTERSILIEPVDILTVATSLAHQGNAVVFHDCDRHDITTRHFGAGEFDLALIGFDYYIPLHTRQAVRLIGDLARTLRCHATIVLVFGRPATYESEMVLSMADAADGCIIGEAEAALDGVSGVRQLRERMLGPHFATRASQRSERAQEPSRPAYNVYVDGLGQNGPIADRTLCDVRDYIDVRSIIASRGCRGVCRFCSTVRYWGRWRGASPALMAAEMTRLRQTGARKAIFLDDSFADDPARVLAFCEIVSAQRGDVVWGCLCRVEDVSEPLLRAMAAGGCRWIHFGIEHGTPEVRARVGKRFTNAEALEKCWCAQALGIRVRTSWILDLPGATSASLDASVDLAMRMGSEEIKLHFLVTRPGSTLYEASRRAWPAGHRPTVTSGEMLIHVGRPAVEGEVSSDDALGRFRHALEPRGYQFVDDATFWQSFDHREAEADARFLSTVVTRYGLGWR